MNESSSWSHVAARKLSSSLILLRGSLLSEAGERVWSTSWVELRRPKLPPLDFPQKALPDCRLAAEKRPGLCLLFDLERVVRTLMRSAAGGADFGTWSEFPVRRWRMRKTRLHLRLRRWRWRRGGGVAGGTEAARECGSQWGPFIDIFGMNCLLYTDPPQKRLVEINSQLNGVLQRVPHYNSSPFLCDICCKTNIQFVPAVFD